MNRIHGNRFLRVPFRASPNFRASLSGFPEYFGLPFSGFPKISGFPFRASPKFRASLFGLPLSGFINNISEIADWYYNVRTLFNTYDNFYSPFNLWVLTRCVSTRHKKKTKSYLLFFCYCYRCRCRCLILRCRYIHFTFG